MTANRAKEKERELQELDDNELLGRLHQGDEQALEVLLARYRNFARAKARSYFLAGSDREDVVQEGMIGLYKAIRDFNLSQQTPFRVFAELCISRQILTAIKTANRVKHSPLNSSISLDYTVGGPDSERLVADTLVAPVTFDPAEMAISAEEVEALRDSMKATLTQLESDVLSLYMDGRSYDEIAGALGSHVKSIDNALQRVKRKLLRHLAERHPAT